MSSVNNDLKFYSSSTQTESTNKSTDRLRLGDNKNSDKNDIRYDAAIKSLEWTNNKDNGVLTNFVRKIYSKLCYVKINATKVNNPENSSQEIYVNVNSLIKRLGLSRSEIKQSVKEGNLKELISKGALTQKKINEQYELITKAYTSENDMKKETGGVNNKHLMSAIKASVSYFFKDGIVDSDKKNPAAFVIDSGILTSYHMFVATCDTDGDLKFLVAKDNPKEDNDNLEFETIQIKNKKDDKNSYKFVVVKNFFNEIGDMFNTGNLDNVLKSQEAANEKMETTLLKKDDKDKIYFKKIKDLNDPNNSDTISFGYLEKVENK